VVFSSVIFLFWFLPAFLALYLLADRKYKNPLILLGSVIFYAWGAPKFIFVFLAASFIDFQIVAAMSRAKDLVGKKRLLYLSLGLNLGLLGFFKYSNFFIENVNASLTGLLSIEWVEVALPLGISFFIFESLTYVIDVYRGVHAPLKNFWDYQMYILFFPKLIAGPIVRYHEIADQIQTRPETSDLFLTGFYRFVIGLAKKVLIANRLGALSAPYFLADPNDLSAGQAWIGLIAALLQMYFDFSGYSDMALGLARMMGFRLPENFNNPLISGSLTEFWQRWHITLSNWMRNYLYIPLGGNRDDAPWKLYRNLGIVFIASGLWHGAAWNFVIWGAFHGFWLIMERLFLLRWLTRLGRFPGMLYTCLLVVVAYGMFKIENVEGAMTYYRAMLGSNPGIEHTPLPEFWWVLSLAIILAWAAVIPPIKRLQDRLYAEQQGNLGHLLLFPAAVVVLVIAASFIVWSPYNPFLYFRF
jgi:alginate O-acetyltransferase complex protein AlgI